MPINHIRFLKYMLLIGVLSTIGNTILYKLWQQNRFIDQSSKYTLIFIAALILNLFCLFFFSWKINRRMIGLGIKIRGIKFFLLQLLLYTPWIGLLIIIALSCSLNAKTFKKILILIILFAFSCGIAWQIFYLKTSFQQANKIIFYEQLNPSGRFIWTLYEEWKNHNIKTKTGFILSIPKDLFFFVEKNDTSIRFEENFDNTLSFFEKETENIKKVIYYNKNIFHLTFPYGVYLFQGNIEIWALALLEDVEQYYFEQTIFFPWNIFFNSLQKALNDRKDLEIESKEKFKKRLRILEKEKNTLMRNAMSL